MPIKTQEELDMHLNSVRKKIESGAKFEDLTDIEKEAVEIRTEMERRAQGDNGSKVIDRHQFEKERYKKETQRVIGSGGKKVIHLTDSEVPAEDLERLILMSIAQDNEVNKGVLSPEIDKNTILVHTGDLMPDFIDKSRNGLESFLPEFMADRGELKGKDREEFMNEYKTFLDYVGIDEDDIKKGQVGEEGLKQMQALLFGYSEPHFLTKDEKKKFQQNAKNLQKYLKKAIKNHASREYKKVKEVLDKVGLTPENLVMVGGNHDVPEIMQEILGEYMISPGEVKDMGGLRVGNVLSGSTGAHMGPHYGDIFGYTDVKEQLSQITQGTKTFQDFKSEMYGLGFDDLSDDHLERLIMNSKQRMAQNIGSGDLAKYFMKYNKPEVDQTISERMGQIPTKIPENVDMLIGHGDPSHPQFSGFEERALHNLLLERGIPYIHGHMHGNTTHGEGKNVSGIGKSGSALYLNPGSAKAGSFGYHLFDKDSKFSGTFSIGRDSEGEHKYEFLLPEQISIRKSDKGGGDRMAG